MLILKRYPGQTARITIGGQTCRVTIHELGTDYVRLGFDAPETVRIERPEARQRVYPPNWDVKPMPKTGRKVIRR